MAEGFGCILGYLGLGVGECLSAHQDLDDDIRWGRALDPETQGLELRLGDLQKS